MPLQLVSTIEVQVTVEVDRSQPCGYKFVKMKVGDEPAVPLPQDKPAPRRLVVLLAEAAAANSPKKK